MRGVRRQYARRTVSAAWTIVGADAPWQRRWVEAAVLLPSLPKLTTHNEAVMDNR